MAIIASEGAKFTPAPAGAHQAVCADVIDMGIVETNYGGEKKSQHKVRVVWQIDQLDPENGKPFIVQKRYTLSLHEKSTLRADLESWRGVAFKPEELKGFDLERLLGANCQLNIVHEIKNGATYANVAALMPLGKGMAKMAVSQDFVRAKDRTPTPAHADPSPFSPDEDPIPF